MTEEQQKAADQIVKAIGEFWGPIVEDVTQRTELTPDHVWLFEVMGSIQTMERQIRRLTMAYEKMAESQQEMKPKTERLLDLSLESLESQTDGWKKDAES